MLLTKTAKKTQCLLFIFFVVLHVVGQTPQKLADINKKVIGKWWSADRKEYIEFLPNGVCAEGYLYSGTWHVQNGNLGAWDQGEEFRCLNGSLSLISPNTLTRDQGMHGEIVKFYRGLQRPKRVPPLTTVSAQRILVQKHQHADR